MRKAEEDAEARKSRPISLPSQLLLTKEMSSSRKEPVEERYINAQVYVPVN